MYAGVDEAGRGPVLGPLVVAGVAGRPDQVPTRVGDSKQLAPQPRRDLAERIHEGPLEVAVAEIPADELNQRMSDGESLDAIEAQAFARVLDQLSVQAAVVDLVGSDPEAFEADLLDRLREPLELTARARADETDPLVGAGSIVAKVRRDARIQALADDVGADIGSGYPSDPTTRTFLETWRGTSAKPPPFARTAWSTLDDLGFGQKRLTGVENPAPWERQDSSDPREDKQEASS